MLKYIANRILLAIPTLVVISIISFIIIQLPPGDLLTSYLAELRQREGEEAANAYAEIIDQYREEYGLNQPIHIQYYKWMRNILLKGDFGRSFEHYRPVKELIWERLGLTVLLTGTTMIFTWMLAIPIGVLSATKQYSIPDYFFSFVSFLGLGIPNFLIALVLMWVAFSYFGTAVTGLFSPEYVDAPWNVAKISNLLSHIWLPVFVLGIGGTAGLIRTMRANMLDEMHKPYVQVARAKGLQERRVIWKYPVRIALNPFISQLGSSFPRLVSGATIVSIVLNLQTSGPVLLRALLSQDMHLAGAFILLLSTLTVIGTLVSDILLVLTDPRIAFGSKATA
jgi:peptide/nickel transport system permease protein